MAAQRPASGAPLAGVCTGTAGGVAPMSKSRPGYGPRQRRQLHAMLGRRQTKTDRNLRLLTGHGAGWGTNRDRTGVTGHGGRWSHESGSHGCDRARRALVA
jgi:hypothetical protein